MLKTAQHVLHIVGKVLWHVPFLGHIWYLIEKLPRTPAAIYHQATHTNPLFVLAVVLVIYVGSVFVGRNLRLLIGASAGVVVLSIVVQGVGVSMGWIAGPSVIGAANKLPVSSRPACIGAATLVGGVWHRSRIATVSQCDAPKTTGKTASKPAGPQPSSPSTGFDDGSDGWLTGTIDGPHWVANVRVKAPNPAWTIRTQKDRGNNRVLYVEDAKGDKGADFQIASCLDDGGAVPQSVKRDTSGISYTKFLFQRANRQSLSQIVPGAGIVNMRRSPLRHGVYELTDSIGQTQAYLVPAAGVFGHCAVVSGPYQRLPVNPLSAQGSKELYDPQPDDWQRREMLLVATNTTVFNLKRSR